MSNPNKKRPLKRYLILTGIAFQMGAIMYLAAYIGRKLDENTGTDQKTYTLIATLIGLVVSIWIVLKQLNSLNK